MQIEGLLRDIQQELQTANDCVSEIAGQTYSRPGSGSKNYISQRNYSQKVLEENFARYSTSYSKVYNMLETTIELHQKFTNETLGINNGSVLPYDNENLENLFVNFRELIGANYEGGSYNALMTEVKKIETTFEARVGWEIEKIRNSFEQVETEN
jgi:hypothetical protein